MRPAAGLALIGCTLVWPAPLIAQEATVERECGIMQRMGFMIEGIPAPWLHVLHREANDGPVAATLPVGTVAVGCVRDSIMPSPHDDRIPLSGIPLTLSVEGARRSLVLRFSEGRFVYQMVQGALSEAEREGVDRRIAEFQARLLPPPR